MTSKTSLAPSLLVAMPDLADPNFSRTVVLLVHHDEDGTVGLVLNRPAEEVRAEDLCETLGVPWRGERERGVHWGGPVQPETGWVVAGDEALAGVAGASPVDAGIHFAGSLEALRVVAAQPPLRLRIFLGYAGWGPGQLEAELIQGAWVMAPLDNVAVFDLSPDQVWDHAWRLLGIDPATVVSTPGIH